jgi:hypothetical protein
MQWWLRTSLAIQRWCWASYKSTKLSNPAISTLCWASNRLMKLWLNSSPPRIRSALLMICICSSGLTSHFRFRRQHYFLRHMRFLRHASRSCG